MINAIIMASGFSSRMGENKLLLKYKGCALVEYVLENVSKSNFSHRLIVTNRIEVIELSKKRNINGIMNLNADLGQSESIKLGILNSPEALGYAFFTGDQPFINEEIITELINEFEQYPNNIIVPIYKGRRGNPVIFPKKYTEELLKLQGDIGGKTVINKFIYQVRFIEIHEELPLWDIDTMEDYNKLLKFGHL